MKDKRGRDDLSSREGERKGRMSGRRGNQSISVVLQNKQHCFCVILSVTERPQKTSNNWALDGASPGTTGCRQVLLMGSSLYRKLELKKKKLEPAYRVGLRPGS